MAMFFKMAAKYGECDSLTYSELVSFKSMTSKAGNHGSRPLNIIHTCRYLFMNAPGSHVFQDGRQLWWMWWFDVLINVFA